MAGKENQLAPIHYDLYSLHSEKARLARTQLTLSARPSAQSFNLGTKTHTVCR